MDERTMIDLHAVPLLVTMPVSFAGGIVLGLVYFHTMRIGADMVVSGERPLLVIAAAILRFALLGAGFALALQAGGAALLAALAGVLVGRGLIIRHRPGAGA